MMSNPVEDDPESTGEALPLLTNSVSIHIYKRRWFILFLYVFSIFNQNMFWNTWGPITDSAELVFDWSDADVAMFANVGNIVIILLMFPTSWMLDVLGLRITISLVAILNFLTPLVRCFDSSDVIMYWTSNVAAVFNGWACALYLTATAVISVTWFPPPERPLATGASFVVASLGMAASMVTGPQMVHYVDPNNTAHNTSSGMFLVSPWNAGNHSAENPIISKQREEIMNLTYLQLGLGTAALLLTLFYFPDKPPLPPSQSAATTRVDFKLGFKTLLTSCQFWMLMLSMNIAAGAIQSWSAVLVISLRSLDVDQTEAGYIGLFSVLTTITLLVLVSIYLSRFMRRGKLVVIAGYLLSSLTFLWLVLLMFKCIPYSLGQVYVSVILSTSISGALSPVFFEMACERFYPVSEAIIGAYLFLAYDISGTLFLLVFNIPNIGDSWIVPSLLALSLITIPLIAPFKPLNRRLEADGLETSVISTP